MIQPVEITYCDKDRNKFYYTVVNDLIYYNNYNDNETCVIKNGNTHVVFKNTCITHNFRPFKYKGIYYGVGGQDNWKCDKKWRGLSYEEFKLEYKNHFGEEYIRGPEFYVKIKERFDGTPIYPHNKGIYLLKSDNGIKWQFVKNDPIMTVKHPGFNDCLEWKSADFDSISEIIRFNDKWYIYLRNNVYIDRRDVQYATSDNLINWSTVKPIQHDYNIDNDNYYCPVMFEHKKKMYGFFNFYDFDRSSIKLKVSEDGEHFKEIGEFFIEKPHEIYQSTQFKHESRMTVKKTKLTSMVCSVEKTDNNLFFWVNHFYANNNKNHNSYLAKYKIPMGDFNVLQ